MQFRPSIGRAVRRATRPSRRPFRVGRNGTEVTWPNPAWSPGKMAVLVGWAVLSPVSGRRVYAGVTEVSVYVSAPATGKGIGKALLGALVAESERIGIWTLQASIFRENVASIALHRACGFREVGYRERIGQMNGVWRDTILMERRSGVVGSPG